MKKTSILLVMLWSILLPAQLVSGMQPVQKLRAGVPPFQIIEQILRNNQQTVTDDTIQNERTAPFLTWLTDSDANISSRHILADSEHKIYVVRNMGSQLALSPGAVDYGVRHLLTPVLLITSNTNNQTIRLFMKGYAGLAEATRKELAQLNLALPRQGDTTINTAQEKTFEEQLLSNIEKNIDYQVARAIARYQDRVQSGRLVIIGSILDLANQYGHGTGRLIIINVNGERDDTRLKELRHMTRLDSELLAVVGRSRLMLP